MVKIIYYKIVSDKKKIDYNFIPMKDHFNFIKYYFVKDFNTHLISYLMKIKFAENNFIFFNEFGKPLIDNGYFNISHDELYCVGIFDKNNSIGIDIVYINKNINFNEFKNVFNDDECKNIFQWSKKEAFLKMLGLGITINLLDVKIINNKIYYKNILQNYEIYEKKIQDYYICVIGSWQHNENFILEEFMY